MAATKTTVASASARNAAASKPAWPRSKESSRSSKANLRILGSERPGADRSPRAHLTFRCVPEGLLKTAQAFKPGISVQPRRRRERLARLGPRLHAAHSDQQSLRSPQTTKARPRVGPVTPLSFPLPSDGRGARGEGRRHPPPLQGPRERSRCRRVLANHAPNREGRNRQVPSPSRRRAVATPGRVSEHSRHARHQTLFYCTPLHFEAFSANSKSFRRLDGLANAHEMQTSE